ncbi:MAG: energy transducer TonB [Pseudomonadota bacterium]
MSTFIHRPRFRIASFGVTALPATLATAGILLLMHSLVVTDMSAPEIRKKERFEVVGKVEEITIAPLTERPQRPQEVTEEPDRMEPDLVVVSDDFTGAWKDYSGTPITEKRLITNNTNMVVPYLRLQPEYPTRALRRGIEGYVDLAFDINATGATNNIRVLHAQPKGVFERAAIRALEKWKYKVPVTDGVPQGQVDMMTRLTFELED